MSYICPSHLDRFSFLESKIKLFSGFVLLPLELGLNTKRLEVVLVKKSRDALFRVGHAFNQDLGTAQQSTSCLVIKRSRARSWALQPFYHLSSVSSKQIINRGATPLKKRGESSCTASGKELQVGIPTWQFFDLVISLSSCRVPIRVSKLPNHNPTTFKQIILAPGLVS